MRKVQLGVFAAIALLAVLCLAPAFAFAADPTVTIKVVGPDGGNVTGAKVILYDTDGKTYENSTDINGETIITVPANGTYLILVKSEYYILDTVDVEGNVSKTVNASTMNHVNVTSYPLTVDASLLLLAFNYTSITVTTNMTVYAPSDLNVSYPAEIEKFPYKYVFDKIKYDGVETNASTVTIDMTRDYVVTGVYTQTFYMALEYWVLIILVLIIVIALVVAFTAGGKTAKTVIEDWKERKRKFVRRKE